MKSQADEYTTEEILKILREWTGLTQKEFAKTIHRTERGLQALELHIKDTNLLRLIKRFLKVGIMKNGKYITS